MIASIFGVVCGIGCIVGLAVALLKIFERIADGRPPTPAEIQALNEEFERRLMNPKFGELEKQFGTIPKVLRELYENKKLIERSDFCFGSDEDAPFISTFEPADLQTVKEFDGWNYKISGKQLFPFAGDGCGDVYLAVFSSDNIDDCPVYFWDHECGDEHRIADSMREFLQREIVEERSKR